MRTPLRFEPILRRYLWGGRRLGTVLGKAIGPEDDYAESWEIVDHGDDQSRVIAGPLAGRTLGAIFAEFGEALFGERYDAWRSEERPAGLQHRFPLLLKFLDCRRDLSVQIHPNDAQARRQDPPDLGKTEAWYVMDAEPGAAVYAGLVTGATRDDLARAIAEGRTESVLHRFHPRPGDCLFIPAGTVHALGAGLLVAELQQASDTTYRLFDWNRVGSDGRPRALHVEQSLAVLRDDCGPVESVRPIRIDDHRERLVEAPQFVLDRIRVDRAGPVRNDRVSGGSGTLGGDGTFHVIAVVEGEGRLEGDPTGRPLRRGETALIPAGCGAVRFEPGDSGAVLLDGYLPAR
ncbi:MAG TPA: mannose-6-phosphate isomerase [Planctomycetaceae bacterium]|nr:mannose-6-phosphate isomerase [Planctomycetaceae bacterium]HRF01602.1 class I mannose-6-phosphate isomerase [Pirellulaceae bacterium]